MEELTPDEGFLQSCLFFTANRLGRAITRIGEEAFAPTGLTPMYGYAIRREAGSRRMPTYVDGEIGEIH